MWALLVVEVHPLSDTGPCLRSCLPGVQVDALVFQGPPQSLDEDVVEKPAFSIHRDPHAGSAEPVRPGEAGELRSSVSIHYLGRAKLVDGLVQRLDAEVRFQRIGDPLGQHLAGEPVHNRDQVEEPTAHRQKRDVGRPDLIRSFHPQYIQQIWPDLVPLGRLACIGLLVDRLQPHEPHKSPDPLLVHWMTFVL